MHWNKWIRQSHRWLSIAFTATVVVAIVAVSQEDPALWLFYLPLFPLVLQLLTGLFLFVLPYTGRWRAGRRTARES